jgi:hypothetical protein
VVDYYNETWRYKPKPFKLNDFVAKKNKMASNEAAEIRDTSMQPTYVLDSKGNVLYNLRKLNELPSFLLQLTSNLAIPLSCQYVYFNYDFMMGLFANLPFQEINDLISTMKQGSSYNLSEEAKACVTDLSLLSIIVLQCGDSMCNEPKSAILQILMRSLNMYGISKNFTKLIDEYDEEMSRLKHGFVLPCQQMESPGTDLIFQLDKHVTPITHSAIGCDNDSMVFTLSNKLHLLNMETIRGVGEEQFDQEFEFFIPFFENNTPDSSIPMKAIEGLIVLGTRDECSVYNCSMNRIFNMKFSDMTLSNLFLVGPSHLALFYTGQKIFDIYDVKKSELHSRITYESVIQNVYCNTHKQHINVLSSFEHDTVWLAVVIGNHELDFIAIDYKEKSISVKKVYRLPSSGQEIYSVSFKKKEVVDFQFSAIRVCYKNGSILYMQNLSEDNEGSAELALNLIKPKAASLKNVYYKFLSSKDYGDLFLGSNNRLYLFVHDDRYDSLYSFTEFDGNFNNGALLTKNSLVGIDQGVFHFFMFSDNKESEDAEKTKRLTLRYVKIAELSLHFDEIVLFFQKGALFSLIKY